MSEFFAEYGIVCPICERKDPDSAEKCDNFLHQKSYRIWPTHEDDLSGKCVTIKDEHKELWVDTETKAGNPSPRCRGAIAIEFWCEMCDSDSTFIIYQHKGVTYLGWK